MYWNQSKTWKFDISDCHSLLTVQNPAKTVHLKTCSKCPLPAFTQAWSLLTKLSIWPCWWRSAADHPIVYLWKIVRIKQLHEFLKSDHLLRIYCILSCGVFYFEPPCIFQSVFEGSYCDSADNYHLTPSQQSHSDSCFHQSYVRRLPDVQYVRNGAVVGNVSLESFRATGGYALSGLRHSDVNNNHGRIALQFSFWQPVTIASMHLVQTRVGSDFSYF